MTTILYAFLLWWGFWILLAVAILGAATVGWVCLFIDDKYGELLAWRFKAAKKRIDQRRV